MTLLFNLLDTDLVERMGDGQEKAFEVLFCRYQKDVYRIVLHYLKNKTASEDLCQDIFLRVYVSLKEGKYNERGTFLAWLLRIAHNMCMDHLRKAARHEYSDNGVPENLLFTSPNTDAENRLVAKQRGQQLSVFIGRLPKDQKKVIYYRYFEELSFKEIATLMNASVNTSLGRMRYGLAHLRKHIVASASFFAS